MKTPKNKLQKVTSKDQAGSMEAASAEITRLRRELEIEAALERVRSKGLAMHHTSDLQDVINTVGEQFNALNMDITGGAFICINEDINKELCVWGAGETAQYMQKVTVHAFDAPIFLNLIARIKAGPGFFTEEYTREEKVAFFQHLFNYPPYNKTSPEHQKEFMAREGGYVRSGVVSRYTTIFMINHHGRKFSEANNNILRRFGRVFEQTYTRFLDLQKAEAQAREAQIQLALERVRARTMAMHKSEELAETAAVLFQQMTDLGVTPERQTIGLIKEETHLIEVWSTDQEGTKINHHFNVSLDEPTTGKHVYDAWKEKKKSLTVDLSGTELNDWIRYVREVMGMTIREEFVKDHRIHSVAFFSHGILLTTTPEPLPDESMRLLERFADVFNLTYQRFLDLQKAEMQAREAQIEAALERVRAKAMAMNSSEHLAETIGILFRELQKLHVTTIRCGVGILNEASRTAELSTVGATNNNDTLDIVGKLAMTGHPVLDGIFEHWKMQKEYHVVLEGEHLKTYYQVVQSEIPVLKLPDIPVQYGSYFYFRDGALYAWSDRQFSDEELRIFRKFASVLGLTYRRFQDLKDAEVRAVEAVRQATLDRVRAEIASMRTAGDLQRITPLIWKELTTLGVPFFRCGVFIVDEAEGHVRVYLSAPDGHSLAALDLPFDANAITKSTVEYWRKGIVYAEHWNQEEFLSWTRSMLELGQIQDPQTYQGATAAPESLDLHFVPFKQGMLYVGNTDPLSKENIDLVKSLAEAFSIAYSRYEDFRKLEEAKQSIEFTLSELKSAQALLIQSEKMASLGELTAGIAHEIQNPLNFVNNFSEVSTELIDEMNAEMERGELDEAKAIASDIQQNLEKITHHGKRADAIVKGMLQHSRSSSGVKEPTDINVLADEYLRLAFHGLRAKDKSFNATIETDFDQSIGMINVVPQDIGRVILNLITNAFYACTERAKVTGVSTSSTTGDGSAVPEPVEGSPSVAYKPTVTVTSKKLSDHVEIRVKDTGNGIPQNVLDKIFQPFFTTKPTGQGTGLGLSLSYDIVKAHGGALEVETEAGTGTTFIVTIPNNQ